MHSLASGLPTVIGLGLHREQVYKGMTSAARGIVQQYGVRGLYTGIGITMVEIVPYAALQFGLYDLFNSAYSRARVRQGLLLGTAIPIGTVAAGCSPARGQYVARSAIATKHSPGLPVSA